MSESFALPSDATAAGVARGHARHLLRRWSLVSLVEPVSLVVSELVGNAVRYGRPPFVLLLRRVGAGVRADVHDDSADPQPRFPSSPVLPDADSTGGRGLGLVQAVSTETGVDQVPHDGKRVWAVVEPPPAD